MADMRMAEMWSPSGWNDPSTASLSQNSLQPLAPGTLMRGRYRIVSQLGKGGTGFVYLVQDENFDARPLRSMKEMILHLDDRQQQVRLVNFKREADVLETLRHTNIPRVYDSFTEFRRAYLVLEYVEGEDLKQVLDRTTGVLSPQVVGSWMIQLCTIVEYLHVHKPPIIFRDLKPSNVILTPDQRIILIDFGIATVFTADEKQTNVGTRGYAALEQYTGEAEIRSDVYALGGMMHHLLTKSDPRLQPPFSFHVRPPNRLNPAVTPELERVIMRCLEDDPDKRYQTVSDLHEALDDALHLSNTDTDTNSLRRADAGHAMLAIANVLAVSAADVADVAHVPPPRSPAPMSPGDAVSAAGTDGADAADTHYGSALATLMHRLPGPGARTGAQRQARAHRGRPHRVPAVWAVVLLSAVVLLLTGGAFAALAPRGAVPIVLAPFTSEDASQVNSTSADSTAQQTPAGTPQPGGTAMPSTSSSLGGAPTPVSTATPLPVPTTAATATPAQPILLISPTAINLSACLATTQAQFTVANTGGMSLSWTASDNGRAYQISPGSGSIAAGGQETVTVSNILLSGSVTVSAPNAQHAPQHASITCTA
jgi:predicted Ser/Thr protein kinase